MFRGFAIVALRARGALFGRGRDTVAPEGGSPRPRKAWSSAECLPCGVGLQRSQGIARFRPESCPLHDGAFVVYYESSAKESPEPLKFVLGRDRGGHWIVQEAHGLCGGLFASKDAAIRYARSECAERAGSVSESAEAIELKYAS